MSVQDDLVRPFDVETVRREFPIVKRLIYLNTGTAGVCPLSVSEALWGSMRTFELDGEAGWGKACERMEAARTRLAAYLGAERDEIAFTRNATDGVNLVVEGIRWQEGDEVLLSDQEHPSMVFPWTYLTQRRPVQLRRFKVGMSDEETLASIRESLTPRTRLLATSHVTSQTGTRVPAREIVRLCHEREIRVLFDGAQAVGQFPIHLSELGVDFYTGNMHKWLHGPKGTGFFYVPKHRVEELTPTWVGAGSGGFSDDDGLTPHPSALRFEYGTRDFGKYGGIVSLFEWHERIGFDVIEARARNLTGYLKEQLRLLPRVRLHSPMEWDASSALTTFSIEGVEASKFIPELDQNHKIRLRGVHEVNGARVSTAIFNTEHEIEFLVKKLRPYVS